MTALGVPRFALRGHFASASTLQQNVSYIEAVMCNTAPRQKEEDIMENCEVQYKSSLEVTT